MLQNDEAVFIRPNDGYKSFTGNLVYKENWEQSVKLMEYSIESSISQSIADIPKSDLVIVAPPLNITKEYRFFAIDRKIITGSLYKENGTKKFSNQYPQQAFDLAQQIIDSTPWQPDPAFSIDICQAYDKYYLLEIGAFSCSGMYHADVTKIVTAASQLAIKEFNDVAV
jgi:hypothetical protein